MQISFAAIMMLMLVPLLVLLLMGAINSGEAKIPKRITFQNQNSLLFIKADTTCERWKNHEELYSAIFACSKGDEIPSEKLCKSHYTIYQKSCQEAPSCS